VSAARVQRKAEEEEKGWQPETRAPEATRAREKTETTRREAREARRNNKLEYSALRDLMSFDFSIHVRFIQFVYIIAHTGKVDPGEATAWTTPSVIGTELQPIEVFFLETYLHRRLFDQIAGSCQL
jgi:hypothetical protein